MASVLSSDGGAGGSNVGAPVWGVAFCTCGKLETGCCATAGRTYTTDAIAKARGRPRSRKLPEFRQKRAGTAVRPQPFSILKMNFNFMSPTYNGLVEVLCGGSEEHTSELQSPCNL